MLPTLLGKDKQALDPNNGILDDHPMYLAGWPLAIPRLSDWRRCIAIR